jgi:prefoldin subunit 5
MGLSKLFDDLEKLITNKRPIYEIKPVLTFLRDQAEALESAHEKLQSEKSEIDKELARLKETNASKTPE